MTTQPYQATEERKHLPQEVRVRNKELTREARNSLSMGTRGNRGDAVQESEAGYRSSTGWSLNHLDLRVFSC